jgi:hypothetical protein
MLIYEINSGIGIGPVRLGSSPADVRAAMGGAPHRFNRWLAEHATEAWHGSAFQVNYRGYPPTVDFIELANSSEFRVHYKGIDVFATRASELVARLSADMPYDPNHRELGYSYIFPAIELSLWRQVMPESDDDRAGQFFDAVGLGIAGYFSGQQRSD